MPTSRVGPTEQVVEAFIENLVEPYLIRLRVSENQPPPPMDGQLVIAKQMHAAALIYNYYHRRQNLSLDFLDVASFCRLAMKVRPALASCLKLTKRRTAAELIGEEDHFSLIEKYIKDACDLSLSLDPSVDSPIVEGCPISKVAVLLVDPENQTCFLHYCKYLDGVWSVIEKDVADLTGFEALALESSGGKRKRDDPKESYEDRELLKVAYDAVKDATGIESSNLAVVESHVTYSLSRAKSAVKFYIMRCSQPFIVSNSIQLSNLVESLQGPLAQKFLDNWTVTSVVEHFPILPYAMFISAWVWGNDKSIEAAISRSFHVKDDQKKKVKQSKAESTASRVNLLQSTEKNAEVRGERKQKFSFVDFMEDDASRSSPNRMLMSDSLLNDGNDKEESHRKVHSAGFSAEKATRVSLKKSNHEASTGKNRSDMAPMLFLKSEENRVGAEIPGRGSSKNVMTPSLGPSKDLIRKRQMNLAMSGPEREDNTVERHSFELYIGNDAASVESQDETAVDSTSNRKKKEEAEQFPDQILAGKVPAITDGQVITFGAGQYRLSSDGILNDVLSVLNRRRQQLYSEFHSIEDKFTTYEDYIERIRDSGNSDLARRCLISILSESSSLLDKNDNSGHGNNAATGSSTPFFLGKSSCDDLEYLCLKNKWRLPKYFVEPIDGKFKAQVLVITKDINLRSEGWHESKPYEARESAAAEMILNIKNTFG